MPKRKPDPSELEPVQDPMERDRWLVETQREAIDSARGIADQTGRSFQAEMPMGGEMVVGPSNRAPYPNPAREYNESRKTSRAKPATAIQPYGGTPLAPGQAVRAPAQDNAKTVVENLAKQYAHDPLQARKALSFLEQQLGEDAKRYPAYATLYVAAQGQTATEAMRARHLAQQKMLEETPTHEVRQRQKLSRGLAEDYAADITAEVDTLIRSGEVTQRDTTAMSDINRILTEAQQAEEKGESVNWELTHKKVERRFNDYAKYREGVEQRGLKAKTRAQTENAISLERIDRQLADAEVDFQARIKMLDKAYDRGKDDDNPMTADQYMEQYRAAQEEYRQVRERLYEERSASQLGAFDPPLPPEVRQQQEQDRATRKENLRTTEDDVIFSGLESGLGLMPDGRPIPVGSAPALKMFKAISDVATSRPKALKRRLESDPDFLSKFRDFYVFSLDQEQRKQLRTLTDALN